MSSSPVYILDISVLLFDPEAIFGFPKKDIVLPVVIFEALDNFKKELGEKGRTARVISQMLDKCCQNGSLVEGVCLQNGSKLRVDLSNPEISPIPFEINAKNFSNKILAVAWILSQKNKEIIFVSQDENLRTKAGIVGVKTISYDGQKKDDSVLFSGIIYYEMSKQKLKRTINKLSFSAEDLFLETN